jgi:hypothetical protein
MTLYQEDPAAETDNPPIATASEVDAAIRDEAKDKKTLEYPGGDFQISHLPSLVEDESFYVSLFHGLLVLSRANGEDLD